MDCRTRRWSEPGLAFWLGLGVLGLLVSRLRSLSFIVRRQDRVNAPDTSASQQPTSTKADRWRVFLALAAGSHFVGFACVPNIIVPPRISQQLGKIEIGAAFLCIPFICSLLLLFRYRTRSERVIAYCSLAGSLLWLAIAASLVAQALRGP